MQKDQMKQNDLPDFQLAWVVALLESNNIDYLVDSGTLLGLVRDGRLMPWDKDIDITIFDKDIDKMPSVLDAATSCGHKVKVNHFRGGVHSYSISPDNLYHNVTFPYIPRKKIPGNRKVSITVLRKKGDVYWGPALYAVGSEKRGLLFSFYRLWRAVIVISSRVLPKNRITNGLFCRDDEQKLKMYRQGTQIVPAHYFENSDRIMGMKIPGNTSEYLRFRYGDWEHPVENWSYMRDDSSFEQKSPEKLGFI